MRSEMVLNLIYGKEQRSGSEDVDDGIRFCQSIRSANQATKGQIHLTVQIPLKPTSNHPRYGLAQRDEPNMTPFGRQRQRGSDFVLTRSQNPSESTARNQNDLEGTRNQATDLEQRLKIGKNLIDSPGMFHIGQNPSKIGSSLSGFDQGLGEVRVILIGGVDDSRARMLPIVLTQIRVDRVKVAGEQIGFGRGRNLSGRALLK